MDVRQLASNVKEGASQRLESWAVPAGLAGADVVLESVGTSVDGRHGERGGSGVGLDVAGAAPEAGAVAGILSSRTVATYWEVVSGGMLPPADEVLRTPVPEVMPAADAQLRLLVQRRAELGSRGRWDGRVGARPAPLDARGLEARRRVDWAIERVVVELYGLTIRDLVALQRTWRS